MSQIFNNLLVVQDAYRNSTKAMEWANQIVPVDGSIMMLDVQPPLSALWQDLLADEYEDSPVYHRQKALRELAVGIDFKVGATARIRSGTPVVQIVRETLANRFDLVVKEAYAKTSDLIFGSLDMRLMRYCPTPVWLAHPEAPTHCSRVMVALNPEASETEMLLNERLLQYASEVARGFSCKLFVVAAFRNPSNLYAIADKESLKRVEAQAKNVARHAREAITKLLADSLKPVEQKNVIVEEGWPDEVIVSAVEDIQPDLLVMGSVARHGISGLLVGNAAERVLRQVDCSVLTIKPQNFVTPIEPDKPRGEQFPKVSLAF